jgi:hypothetical protein
VTVVKRYGTETDEDGNEVENPQGEFVHFLDYQKLERKVRRLEKRLLEKKVFEKEDLIQRGATPRFIEKIDEKDREAMSD